MRTMWHISGRLGNQMFQFAYLYSQARKGLIPNVYVQDEKFFHEFKEEIRRLYGDGIEKEALPYVSIHVRRGDYVNNDFYIDLFEDGYYQRAMSQFPGDQFMVFSDDISWCKQQEIFKDCIFSDERDEIIDLNKMASCKGHIIGNSSYSWWGAWLGGGKVVAPNKWYTLSSPNDGESVIPRTGLPEEWIKV